MPSAIPNMVFKEEAEQPLVEPKFLNTPDGKPLKKSTVTKKAWSWPDMQDNVPVEGGVVGGVGHLLGDGGEEQQPVIGDLL